MSTLYYKIPGLLDNLPWSRTLSPYYEEVQHEATEWVRGYHPFSPRGQKTFDACNFNLLGALTYPGRRREFLRLGCDLINLLFVYDEYSDVSDPEIVDKLEDIVVDALLNPYLPSASASSNRPHVLAEMTRDFCCRLKRFDPDGMSAFRHFVEAMRAYLHAVSQEARDRQSHLVRTVESYFSIRRDACAVLVVLALTEFELDLPDEVMEHPSVKALRYGSVDLVILVNDMHSYAREISCGQAEHNLITVIKNQYNLELQDALNWLGDYTEGIVQKFIADRASLPSTWPGTTEGKLDMYIDGLGHWAKGNEAWSFESGRYHSNRGDGLRFVTELGPAVWITSPRNSNMRNYVAREEVEKSIMYDSSSEVLEGVRMEEFPQAIIQVLQDTVSTARTIAQYITGLLITSRSRFWALVT